MLLKPTGEANGEVRANRCSPLLTILLVEEHPGDARLVREMLWEARASQFQLLHAARLSEALAYLATETIAVILLDLSLPDEQGLATLTRLQAMATDIPIVVMSGLSDEEIAIKALQQGAQDYIVKGHVDNYRLLRSIRYAIERQRMQLQLQHQERALQQQLARDRLLAAVAQRIRRSLHLDEILQTTVTEVRQFLQTDRVGIYRIELIDDASATESVAALVAESMAPEWAIDAAVWERHRIWLKDAEAGWEQEVRVVDDVHQEDLTPECRQLMADLHIAAKLVAPLLQNNQVWGLLAVHQCDRPRQWQSFEIDFLEQLATQVAIAIQQSELYQQVKSLNAELETQVQERTQQLTTEKALLEAVLNSIQEGIAVMRPDGQIVLSNPALWQIYALGLPKPLPHLGECLSALRFYHFDGSSLTGEELPSSRVFQGEMVTDEHLVVRCPNGEEKWVSVSAAVVRDRVLDVQLAVTTTRDITFAKQAEAALRQSEAKFRAIFERAALGICLANTETRILDSNPVLQAMLGYSNKELCSMSFSDYTYPDDRAPTLTLFTEMMAGKQDHFHMEKRYVRKDGRLIWIYQIASLVRDSVGKPLFVFGLTEDITQRRQTEIELRQAKELAEAGSQAKSAFLATMSHELRTPLTAVLGMSQLLGQEIYGGLNSKQKEYIQCIHNSGKHLLELINDILDLSKVEAGKEELTLVPLKVRGVCEHCVAMVREQAYEKGLQLQSQIEPQVDICTADERRLKQMLLNLLRNAIKFTPAGKVLLLVREVPQGIEFTVSDTGIGIAAEQLPLLFKSFSQLDSLLNRQYEGTGLGLALTHQLALLHGGNVTVKSILDQGSQFTLFLPESVGIVGEMR